MTADTSSAITMHTPGMATTTIMSDSASSSPSNPPPTTIFWQPCISLQRPSSKSASVELPSFVYPHPKHSSPTIVGVAIKRTLKSPETPSQLSTSLTKTKAISSDHFAECYEIQSKCDRLKSIDLVDSSSEVISDKSDGSELNHPLKDLFLRTLREKDVNYISERLKNDFFDETIALLNGKHDDRVTTMSEVHMELDRITNIFTDGEF